MKSRIAAAMIALIILAVVAQTRALDTGLEKAKAHPEQEGKSDAQLLPPVSAGVIELKFSEFFVSPFGDRGLKLTEKLRGLDGKRVRMLGYMVQEEKPTPGTFILSPYPVQIHDHDNALSDDLPPSVVHVSVPTGHNQPVPFSPRLMLLTGTLSVGNRNEADGRISIVRLAADGPEAASKENAFSKRSINKRKINSSRKGTKYE